MLNIIISMGFGTFHAQKAQKTMFPGLFAAVYMDGCLVFCRQYTFKVTDRLGYTC
jgi:hypothetical protein